MKVGVYSRKSKFTGKGESIENQVQLCKEYAINTFKATEEDFIIYEDEGYSGGNTKRPYFQKMMKDAKDKKFDILICYRLDRISRNVSDFSQLIKELENYGVGFVSIREQFDTTTPMGRAMMYIASVFSQLERETIAERIRDNMIQLAKTGRWLGGNTPTGYASEAIVSNDDNGKERKQFKLTIIPDEINLIKLIYEKYLKLKSITKVEHYLFENYVITKSGADFKRYSLRFILGNPVYAIADKKMYDYLTKSGYDVCADVEEFDGIHGLMVYNKTKQNKETNSSRFRDGSEWIVAVGKHEGIILSEDWIKVQSMLLENKSKTFRKVKSSQSLLSGLLRCANCGSYMRPKTIQRMNEEGEQVFYYMCETKEKSKKKRCNIPNVNGNVLDESVLKEVKFLASENSPIFEKVNNKKLIVEDSKSSLQAEIEMLQNKITESDNGLQNMITAIAKGQNDEVLKMIFTRMEEMNKEKELCKQRLKEIESVEKVVDFNELNLELVKESLMNLNDSSWDKMDAITKRDMLKSVIDKIYWDGSKVDLMLFGSNVLKKKMGFDFPLLNQNMFPHCENRK